MSTQRIEWSVALVVVAAALLWLPPLSSSLWLDELDTYFTIKDGVTTAIARTAEVHPQCSQLYNALMALWVRGVGSSEALLRVPSVAAMATAAYLVFRLGRLLFDRETGVLAALVFVTSRDVLFAAADARSYACAAAAGVAATIVLVHFIAPTTLFPDHTAGAAASRRRRRLRYGVAYAAMAALTVYFHQLFGLLLVAHAVFVVVELVRGEAQASIAEIFGIGLLAFLLLSGEASNLAVTFIGRERLVYGVVPTPLFLLYVWASPLFVAAVAPVAFVLYARRRRGSVTLPAAPIATWALLLASAVVPPLALFVASRVSDTHVFLPRYYLSAQPALAILLGAILRGFEPYKARMWAATSVAVVSLFLHVRPYHSAENWRDVIAGLNATIDDRTVVAVDAGFVEAADPAWLELPLHDPRRAFLLAPLSYYPLRGRVELLPFRITANTRLYLERSVRPKLLAEDRFVVLGRGRAPRWWALWFDGRFAEDGYVARPLHKSLFLETVSYERRLDANHIPPATPSTNGSTK